MTALKIPGVINGDGLLFEIIGVVHLPRLPYTYSKPQQSLEDVVMQAVQEARALEELGYTGVIVENYGDTPYTKRVRDPLAIAFMSVVVREVVRSTGFKVGVNLLRNSGKEAYSIAVASGAKFIRVNALVETVISDSGILEPSAPLLKPLYLNYPGIEVYADIMVKHASSLRLSTSIVEAGSTISKGPIEAYLQEVVEDHVRRGGASALVVTGLKTGDPPPLKLLELVKKYSPVRVIAGSGATPENVCKLLKFCDGVIVGSFIKRDGKAGNPLDPGRARSFIERVRSCSLY